MREIKFRGKEKRTGGWRYGFLVQIHQSERMFIGEWRRIGGEATIRDELFSSYKEVDPKTVGEFTGLHDADGREIWEGDKYLDHDDRHEYVVAYSGIYASFVLEGKVGSPYHNSSLAPLHKDPALHKIGNIHENTPDVLNSAVEPTEEK